MGWRCHELKAGTPEFQTRPPPCPHAPMSQASTSKVTPSLSQVLEIATKSRVESRLKAQRDAQSSVAVTRTKRRRDSPTDNRSVSQDSPSDIVHVLPMLEAANDNDIYAASTFGGIGDYMRRKRQKLQIQNQQSIQDSPILKPQIFKDISIWVSLAHAEFLLVIDQESRLMAVRSRPRSRSETSSLSTAERITIIWTAWASSRTSSPVTLHPQNGES